MRANYFRRIFCVECQGTL